MTTNTPIPSSSPSPPSPPSTSSPERRGRNPNRRHLPPSSLHTNSSSPSPNNNAAAATPNKQHRNNDDDDNDDDEHDSSSLSLELSSSSPSKVQYATYRRSSSSSGSGGDGTGVDGGGLVSGGVPGGGGGGDKNNPSSSSSSSPTRTRGSFTAAAAIHHGPSPSPYFESIPELSSVSHHSSSTGGGGGGDATGAGKASRQSSPLVERKPSSPKYPSFGKEEDDDEHQYDDDHFDNDNDITLTQEEIEHTPRLTTSSSSGLDLQNNNPHHHNHNQIYASGGGSGITTTGTETEEELEPWAPYHPIPPPHGQYQYPNNSSGSGVGDTTAGGGGYGGRALRGRGSLDEGLGLGGSGAGLRGELGAGRRRSSLSPPPPGGRKPSFTVSVSGSSIRRSSPMPSPSLNQTHQYQSHSQYHQSLGQSSATIQAPMFSSGGPSVTSQPQPTPQPHPGFASRVPKALRPTLTGTAPNVGSSSSLIGGSGGSSGSGSGIHQPQPHRRTSSGAGRIPSTPPIAEVMMMNHRESSSSASGIGSSSLARAPSFPIASNSGATAAAATTSTPTGRGKGSLITTTFNNNNNNNLNPNNNNKKKRRHHYGYETAISPRVPPSDVVPIWHRDRKSRYSVASNVSSGSGKPGSSIAAAAAGGIKKKGINRRSRGRGGFRSSNTSSSYMGGVDRDGVEGVGGGRIRPPTIQDHVRFTSSPSFSFSDTTATATEDDRTGLGGGSSYFDNEGRSSSNSSTGQERGGDDDDDFGYMDDDDDGVGDEEDEEDEDEGLEGEDEEEDDEGIGWRKWNRRLSTRGGGGKGVWHWLWPWGGNKEEDEIFEDDEEEEEEEDLDPVQLYRRNHPHLFRSQSRNQPSFPSPSKLSSNTRSSPRNLENRNGNVEGYENDDGSNAIRDLPDPIIPDPDALPTSSNPSPLLPDEPSSSSVRPSPHHGTPNTPTRPGNSPSLAATITPSPGRGQADGYFTSSPNSIPSPSLGSSATGGGGANNGGHGYGTFQSRSTPDFSSLQVPPRWDGGGGSGGGGKPLSSGRFNSYQSQSSPRRPSFHSKSHSDPNTRTFKSNRTYQIYSPNDSDSDGDNWGWRSSHHRKRRGRDPSSFTAKIARYWRKLGRKMNRPSPWRVFPVALLLGIGGGFIIPSGPLLMRLIACKWYYSMHDPPSSFPSPSDALSLFARPQPDFDFSGPGSNPIDPICNRPEVESLTGGVVTTANIIENVLSIFSLSVFSGVLSMLGRKTCLILVMVAIIIQVFVLILSVIFVGPVGVVLLFTSSVIGGFAGEGLISLAIKMYILDTCKPAEIASFLSIILGAFQASAPVSMFVGGKISVWTGRFLAPYYIAVLLYFLLLLFIVAFVPESLTPERKRLLQSKAAPSLLSPSSADPPPNNQNRRHRDHESSRELIESHNIIWSRIKAVFEHINPLARLKILLPKKYCDPKSLNGTNGLKTPQKYSGVFLASITLFLAMVAVKFVPELMLLIATRKLGWGTTETGEFLGISAAAKAVLLIFVFPFVFRHGRDWYSLQRRLAEASAAEKRRFLEGGESATGSGTVTVNAGSSNSNSEYETDPADQERGGQAEADVQTNEREGLLANSSWGRRRSSSLGAIPEPSNNRPNGGVSAGSSSTTISAAGTRETSTPKSKKELQKPNRFDVWFTFVSFLLDIIGLIGLGFATNIPSLLACMTMFALSCGSGAALEAWLAANVEKSETDQLLGSVAIIERVTRVASPFVLGSLYTANPDSDAIWFVSAAILAVGTFILLFVRDRPSYLRPFNTRRTSSYSHSISSRV